ncbi:sodium-coupled monocarboxylate transporter 2-like [Dermacentor albipictus]|uniref:sodium-coupled monocarboxylate transporter 2-like n=1 Tax=Dermacentor albipictus TaxID=60249 RepID=UPI0038FC612D
MAAASSFAALDYVVLTGFLALSAGIGAFFAWRDRRDNSNRQFLTANKQLGWLPVSVSMVASFVSASSILGLPSQVFVRGSTLWMNAVSSTLAVLVAAFVFLPMYYNMGITSINEYLEKRFMSTAVRNIASAVFIVQTLLYMGVVLYGPSLTLGSVTSLPVWSSILLNGFVCTFYTTIGGIKAVVWTDVVQMVLIYAGYTMVIASGISHLGGFGAMWEIANEGGRVIITNFSTSPYETYTSWNLLLGATVSWTSTYCASQTQLQRYSSIGSLQDARRALLLNIPGVAVTLLMSVLSGLTIYAVYWDCDPMLTGDIDKPDQLMPYIVQDLLHWYPGLTGLLVAAVFSGSLSTLSSGYNALAAVTWHDFVRPKVNLTEAAALRVTKCMAAAYGLLSIAIAFLAGATESIVHATASLVGALSGPLLAIFVLGIFFPCCRKKGAMAGILVGIAISGWQALGSIVYPRQADELPTSTAGCSNFNRTIHAGSYDSPPAPSGILRFYHISFMWVVLVGFLTHVIVSLVVSLVFERNEKDCVDPPYICPFIRPCMGNYTRRSKDADNALGEQLPMDGTAPTEICELMLEWQQPIRSTSA